MNLWLAGLFTVMFFVDLFWKWRIEARLKELERK